MSREDKIREAERKVIEAAGRLWRAMGSCQERPPGVTNEVWELYSACHGLEVLRRPPTALDVIERVRAAVGDSSGNAAIFCERERMLRVCDELEREVRGESKP